MAVGFGRILPWFIRKVCLKLLLCLIVVVLCVSFLTFAKRSNSSTNLPGEKTSNLQAVHSTDMELKTRKKTTVTPHQTKQVVELPKTSGRSVTNCRRVFPRQPAISRTKFSLIVPHIEPNISCEDSELFVAVVVNSASAKTHRALRMAIRRTWGKQITNTTNFRVFFALGIDVNRAYNLLNEHEARQFNDIIIGNFSDTYENIPVKTFMSHFWAYYKLSSIYVLKTDDDVYVRVPRLSHWLHNNAIPHRFYGGFINYVNIVNRDPSSKWSVTKEEFSETRWPPFCHGAFHVLSTDILPGYFNYSSFVMKPLRTDDAYIGVVARALGIGVTHIPEFTFRIPETDQHLLTSTAFGHQINAYSMDRYYESYKRLNAI